MQREAQRREDAVAAAEQAAVDERNATIARRQRRKEMREELRISQMQTSIMTELVQNLNKVEFKQDFTVLDMGDTDSYHDLQSHDSTRGFLFAIGGLLGEILLVCSALQQAYDKQELPYTAITPDMFEHLLTALFDRDLGRLPLPVMGQIPTEDSIDTQLAFLKANLRSVGLQFVLENGLYNGQMCDSLLGAVLGILKDKATHQRQQQEQQDEDGGSVRANLHLGRKA